VAEHSLCKATSLTILTYSPSCYHHVIACHIPRSGLQACMSSRSRPFSSVLLDCSAPAAKTWVLASGSTVSRRGSTLGIPGRLGSMQRAAMMRRHCRRRCPCRAAAARLAARSVTRLAPAAASLPGPRCPARAPCAPAPPSARGAPPPVGSSQCVQPHARWHHVCHYRPCTWCVRSASTRDQPGRGYNNLTSTQSPANYCSRIACLACSASPSGSAVHTACAPSACRHRARGNLVRHVPTMPTTKS